MAKLIIPLIVLLVISLSFVMFAEGQRPEPLPIPDGDDDRDGIPNSIDKCPREPETFNGFEDEDGCPDVRPVIDTDKDGIEDSLDKCPKEPENINGFEDNDGCPDDPRGPTKVKIFAEVKGKAILLSWDTPIDTVANITYQYKLLRSSDSGKYESITSSERNVKEKVVTEMKEERFFYLDVDVKPEINYTYQIITENPVDQKTIFSEPSNWIIISSKVTSSNTVAKAFLIEGRELTMIKVPPPPPITKVSWIDWFNPFKLVNAETFVIDTFTTVLNPQNDSYRLALEPIQGTQNQTDCDQVLQFEYSKEIPNGQTFDITTTIFEKQFIYDDIGPNGTEVESQIEIQRHQKLFHIDNFTKIDTVKQKWFVINPQNQTIQNFYNLEIQFDITAENVQPVDYRQLRFWDIFLTVPTNSIC